ncbi:hypothetical protein OEA41_006779 [Lepraria neglecta]|uniref:C2H2-type domain-containing protein n=1 Tax=Lepraria neglecta TaxID=209136 RepID=A0AAD9Z8F4_9LECA|nr:hypothetical protein OEA41_006779 [Lepraria neglecta]
MSEQQSQSLPYGSTQPRVKKEHTSPSAPSSASEDKSASSYPTRRRRVSSNSPDNTMSSGKPRESTRQRQRARAMPFRGQGGSSRGTGIMATPGLLNPAEEITYTPTTHRISKAKKGKKVHACEYPGCTKVFTRAEHRKRHEANHNTSPAFQCEIDECRKPFQRADLLARHMERQHNMPSAEASAFRSQYRQSSTSDVSRSPRGSFSASQMGQPATATAPSLPQPSGTMSIGSIIEPNMRSEFKNEFTSHAGPRISDYLQPPAVAQPFYSQEIIQRPQSTTTAIESCFHPIIQSPMSAGPATPATWNQFDPAALGFGPEPQCLPPQRQFQFHSPSWPGANGIPSYELNMHSQQHWPGQYLGQTHHPAANRYEIIP